MKKLLQVHNDKSLRLDNVLIKEVFNTLEDEAQESGAISIDFIVTQMENQIRSKGAKTIGPLIQYMGAESTRDEELNLSLSLLIQADSFIHKLDPGYRMERVVSVKNCMYIRFIGLEEDLQIAYQKLQVEAYEADIKLKGSSYTVFVDADDDGYITADIFMEKEM